MDDDSTLYLVRIWRPDGAFRAVVRPVESEVSETFNDASELLQFFAQTLAGTAVAGQERGPGERK